MKKYIPKIGLEIHVELATKSKMFCGCPAEHFRVEPNTHTCPVCLGLPGSLPVANEKAIRDAIKIGLSLNGEVSTGSKFDRKQYFYPDLPKGYQISQYDEPLCMGGFVKISSGKVRITRVHLEEDTGKLVHRRVDGQEATLVDFNRSGVPLVEIVTEPDIRSAQQAKEIAKNIKRLVRWLGVSDCDMEKGSMRLEANISLKSNNPKLKGNNSKLPDYKVEVKNINSFRFLEKAINYEIKRQSKLLLEGKKIKQDTRGWDEAKNRTRSQRFKEKESDYRYFPEPDIPPMEFTRGFINEIAKTIPMLPQEYEKMFKGVYRLSDQYIRVLTEDYSKARYAEIALREAKINNVDPKEVAREIVNQKTDVNKSSPKILVLNLKKEKTEKVNDKSKIGKWVLASIEESRKAAADYKAGKKEASAVIIGKVMQKSKGKANASLVKKLIEEELDAR